MMTWTLYLPDGPVEIQAEDITQATACARAQLERRGIYGPSFRLVNDLTGKTNHAQRMDLPAGVWKAAADAPLLGSFTDPACASDVTIYGAGSA